MGSMICTTIDRRHFYELSQYLLSPAPVSAITHRSISYTPTGDTATTRDRYYNDR